VDGNSPRRDGGEDFEMIQELIGGASLSIPKSAIAAEAYRAIKKEHPGGAAQTNLLAQFARTPLLFYLSILFIFIKF
jgi:hypothetical protein